MSTLFSTATPASADLPETSLRIQTSVEGTARPIVWGYTRLAGNLTWYNDFSAVAATSPSTSGGKGSIFGPPAAASSSSGFNYYASVEIAMGEGPIGFTGTLWADKSILGDLSDINVAALDGDGAQLPWSYLTSAHPDQALAYRWTALIVGNLNLGGSPNLPNWTFEVFNPTISNGAPGVLDAEFTSFLTDFFTNVNYGVPGWVSNFNADWTQAKNYALSAGLFVSLALTSQQSAQSLLTDIIESFNLMPVWSDGTLKLVPLGDTAIAGNGAAYFPPTTPEYDFDDTDYLPNQGGFGTTSEDPVAGQRKSPREQNNIIKVAWLDRSNQYNPAQVPAQDDGAILLYGLRGSQDVKQWTWFQTLASASMAAQLALGREQIQNSYSWTVRPRFVLLDPGDIVTITDSALGLFRQWVRITDIQENADRSFNILATEYLAGTAAAPAYGREVSNGSFPNFNADPGATNQPIFFEPTDELGHGLFVWAAVSGVLPEVYGGCTAYISTDGLAYTPVGKQFGAARMGVLTGSLAPTSVNMTGQTIDQINTLSVDLTMSDGELVTATQADALALNTACYVDGEIVSYATATLVGANMYALTYLVRGAFGTETDIVTHPAGSNFARLDTGILKIPYDQSRIGSTIFIKLVPFNIWGGGGKTLADVPEYTYTITGSALASPLPAVTNVRTVFEAGFAKIWWDEVSDFRSGISYLIRKGDSFASGQDLGSLAHPPFVAFGAGNYWIMPTCQPVANLVVFGEFAVEISIQGNMLTANVVQTLDFQALGWPGFFTNISKEGSDPTALLRISGATNILSEANVLTDTDILNSGGTFLSGTYEAIAPTILNAGYVADCAINVSWTSAGLPIGQDVLSMPNVLTQPDILASASSLFVTVFVEIRTAISATNDFFGSPDMFAEPDMFLTEVNWSAWQRFVPGVYRCQFAQMRAVFATVDPQTIAYLTSMTSQVSIPARIDHYMGNNVTSGGLTIIFTPDDTTTAKPFNGGPLNAGTNLSLPTVTMDWPSSPNVNFVIDAISLSQLTFHFEDTTGAHVSVASVDTYVEGF